jgi:hypothetical protein
VPSPSLPLTSPATRRNREPRAAAAAAVPSEVEPQIPGPRRAGLPHWLRGARVQAMRGARQVAGGYSRRASPDSASATRRLRWDPGWLLLDRSLDACVRRLRPHATSRSAGRLQSTNLCFGVPPLNRRSRQQKIPVGWHSQAVELLIHFALTQRASPRTSGFATGYQGTEEAI